MTRRVPRVACQFACLALGLLILRGEAHAQTVTVTRALPGASVEAVWNMDPAGTATVDARGNATIAVGRLTGDATMDSRVLVDTCDRRWRVLVVGLAVAAPVTEVGCTRQEIAGIFVVRAISTLVVNVGSVSTLRLRQGPFDPLAPLAGTEGAPTGLVLFGGAGLTNVGGDAGSRSCGQVVGCERDGSGIGYATGVAFWFAPFVAAEIAFQKPSDLGVVGSDLGHSFTGALDASALTLAGVVGMPVGKVRYYGKIGITYHQATFTATQTIDPVSIAIDEGSTLTIPGGTQTLQSRTKGRGLVYGGGFEVWASPTFGFYVEAGRTGLKGTDLDGGEAALDDGVVYVIGGVRLHLWR